MVSFQNTVPLSDEMFRLIRDILYDAAGVYYDENSKYVIESRLQNTLQKRQFNSFQDYYHFLKYDREKIKELEHLIDLMTVHETYFFREERQLRAFSDEILPALYDQRRQSKSPGMKIWSAGCSTGEEAYTLSILILEKKIFDDWKVEILASDISHPVLQSARAGYYKGASFRSIDPYFLIKYFQREGDGYRIMDRAKAPITFMAMNLARPETWKFMNGIDVIFCRNVIIYFSKDVKRKTIGGFHRSLSDGGYLILGHSESLIDLSTDYALRHLKNDIVYCKG